MINVGRGDRAFWKDAGSGENLNSERLIKSAAALKNQQGFL